MNRVRTPTAVTEISVPFSELILLDGHISLVQARMLKDDGFNNNFVSKSFFDQHTDRFNVKIRPWSFPIQNGTPRKR